MLREKEIHGVSGWFMLVLLLILVIVSIVMLMRSAMGHEGWNALAWVLLLVVSAVSLFGLTIVNPNQAKVV